MASFSPLFARFHPFSTNFTPVHPCRCFSTFAGGCWMMMMGNHPTTSTSSFQAASEKLGRASKKTLPAIGPGFRAQLQCLALAVDPGLYGQASSSEGRGARNNFPRQPSLTSQRHTNTTGHQSQVRPPVSTNPHHPRGGRPLGPGRQLPPQLTVGRRPLGGGGGKGGGSRRGAGEGGSRGGGGRFPGFPWGGGGVSGTSDQLGMRPRCDPTVRTAPSHNRG